MEDKLKTQTINAQMLTKDQEKLFWAERTINKFKKYDKKRSEYLHTLERDYQTLRKRYDELENDLCGDGPITKGAKKRNRKIREYNMIMRGERALLVMQEKYMLDGQYTTEFNEFLRDYDAAMMKEQMERLVVKNKKLEKEKDELLYQLIRCRKRIAELESSANNS